MTYRTLAPSSTLATSAGSMAPACIADSCIPNEMSSAAVGRRMIVGNMRLSYRICAVRASVHPDVLVPQLRMFPDERGHHLDALGVAKVDHLDAVAAHELGRAAAGPFAAGEVDRFADDHLGHTELHGGAAAQVAGHQRRIEDGVLVGALPAGFREAVDLCVGHRVAVLDAAVVSSCDDLVVAHEHGADRQPALGQAELRFVDGGAEEGVHGRSLTPSAGVTKAFRSRST